MTCRDSTYIIANLRAWRREAYLSRLRPSFSQVEKGILRRSSIFTPLLFDEDQLQEALQSFKSNADRMLHEAALRALAQPVPAPGMPPTFYLHCCQTLCCSRPQTFLRRSCQGLPGGGAVGGTHSFCPSVQGVGWKGKPYCK
ncbi:hypothetical protein E2C01_058870 [Portunus trituberculatus]|uniref:Uncharacterized protein n=1 Tax=Portunus trituberculatus TaxID=210409 RepID=A0A5B7GXJ6_PORTR|nr:hypothetical protein [Portunus trituberculatus]